MKGGGGGAHVAAIVYDAELTLTLPRAETGGTALNALAHCAEALYVQGRNDDADREALAGAALIADALPRVLEDGSDEARRELLEGAMHAGAALAGAGLGLAHAMAQALGGRFGIPHGAVNALCLPPALRFNEPVAGEAIARFGGDADRRTRSAGRGARAPAAASSGSATSACRRTSSTRSPRRSSSGRAPRRTRARHPRPRSPSCSAPSGSRESSEWRHGRRLARNRESPRRGKGP